MKYLVVGTSMEQWRLIVDATSSDHAKQLVWNADLAELPLANVTTLPTLPPRQIVVLDHRRAASNLANIAISTTRLFDEQTDLLALSEREEADR